MMACALVWKHLYIQLLLVSYMPSNEDLLDTVGENAIISECYPCVPVLEKLIFSTAVHRRSQMFITCFSCVRQCKCDGKLSSQEFLRRSASSSSRKHHELVGWIQLCFRSTCPEVSNCDWLIFMSVRLIFPV